jgi:hypothetical protein
MADSVSMKYSGPDNLAFDPIAMYNDGSRYAQNGLEIEVDEETARYLDIFEGWSREGDKSISEKIAEQREALEDDEKAAVRGDKGSMEAFNESAVVSGGSEQGSEEE